MASYLVRKILRAARTKIGLPAPLASRRLGTYKLVFREGCLRKKTDYDDAWFYLCANRAKVVFDIGANVGGDSLYALVANPDSFVYCIEANPRALILAAENIILNHLSHRVQFINGFVSDTENSVVEFWTVGTGAAGSVYKEHARSANRTNQSQKVSTLTVDALCRRYHTLPDFIKVDVEGAEREVLKGALTTLGHKKSRVLVEMHSNEGLSMRENTEAVLELCGECNYKAWYLAKGQELKSPMPVEKRGRCHLLLQPDSWEFPSWLANIGQSTPIQQVIEPPPVD